jgi:carbonic anhydrase/acetyltransferase-like protein (isoleucine patch superfamily)
MHPSRFFRFSASYLGRKPHVHAEAFVHPDARVYGAVSVGKGSSIWPGAILRADVNEIVIGENSSIQDGTVVHVRGDFPPQQGQATVIGNFVTIGHAVKLHACEISDHALVGIGAVVLDGARVGSGTILGAGAVLPPGKFADGGLWVGNPAKFLRPLTDHERAMISANAANYVALAQTWRDFLSS